MKLSHAEEYIMGYIYREIRINSWFGWLAMFDGISTPVG